MSGSGSHKIEPKTREYRYLIPALAHTSPQASTRATVQHLCKVARRNPRALTHAGTRPDAIAAALLGLEEVGFATVPLSRTGGIMVQKCRTTLCQWHGQTLVSHLACALGARSVG